jgi:hypothetical protein
LVEVAHRQVEDVRKMMMTQILTMATSQLPPPPPLTPTHHPSTIPPFALAMMPMMAP